MQFGNKRIADTAEMKCQWADKEPILLTDGRQLTFTIKGGHVREIDEMAKTYARAVEKANRTKAPPPDAAEYIVNVAVAAVIDWNVEIDGQPVPCTQQERRNFFSDPRFEFLALQTFNRVHEQALFLQSVEPSSPSG